MIVVGDSEPGRRGNRPTPQNVARQAPGPTPDSEPDWLRMTPEKPPAPVPAPVPDERPGPPVIWAWAGQLQPSARLKTRVADFVLTSKCAQHAADPPTW